MLDAPNLIDDFYLNLLDWSKDGHLAIALQPEIYIQNTSNDDIQPLRSDSDNGCDATSIAWHENSKLLAVGYANTTIKIWDTHRMKVIRTIVAHDDRVSSLSWNENLLASGSKDTFIKIHDVTNGELMKSSQGHVKEVCGLKWSPDGTQLASGSNDNKLCIWDYNTSRSEPRFTLTQHSAAVKAIAWCPLQPSLLATGGGSKDRMIRVWNTQTGEMICEENAESQVCSLVWSKFSKELVSSHGYEKNQISIWSFSNNSSLVKKHDLFGHTKRVLHLALSPDGVSVASAAGDETLRFWKVFDKPRVEFGEKSMSVADLIR